MDEESVVMGLVLVLVAAVVCALIAFVVLPGLGSGRADGDSAVTKVGMQDYVNDINDANKSGHDYDMSQDSRMQEMQREIAELEHHEHSGQSGQGSYAALTPALASIANQIRIETPSEANAVPMITLGQLSAPMDGSKVCWGGNCYTIPLPTKTTTPLAPAPAPTPSPSSID